MENQILSHASEQLIPGLSYTLGPTAQFVRSRQATTFFPSGGNQYSITGVRVLRFELQSGGDMFLDPATIRLAFTLRNLETTAIRPLKPLDNSPLCLFQRLRVLMKGTLVEDINYLHRTENMFDILLPPQRRKCARRCRCWATPHSQATTAPPRCPRACPSSPSTTFSGRR